MLSLKPYSVLVILIILFNTVLIYAQTKISGKVQDSIGPIYSVSVVLKDSSSTKILEYTYTDKTGFYDISTSQVGAMNVVFSSLGYQSRTIPIKLVEGQSIMELNVNMIEELVNLDEVVIEAEKSIVVRKDTIAYKTKFFTDGTESTVEDLLKKIPGLIIDDEGTIKIGNQEIEKLMVDGDDFFERGYKILSKNMPAYPIEEVELLKRFSNNPLLKDIEESNKVALNLKLNEKAKRVWFGNANVAYGNDNFNEIKLNLMNFGKKNKYYMLFNSNNVGFDATGSIDQLIRPSTSNGAGSLGNGQSVQNLIDLSAGALNFKRVRTNFNNLKLTSINTIFNPSEKLKIKATGFFNWDDADFYRNSIDVVDVSGSSFMNAENYQLKNKSQIAFGKLDLAYNISKNKSIEAVTKYNNANYNDGSNLIFNGESSIEKLRHQNTLFDQTFNYTNKFKATKAFLLTARFINERSPQTYSLNQFFYDDLFAETSGVNNVAQTSSSDMSFMGFKGHLMDRRSNGDLLELKVGIDYRQDQLITNFSILNDDSLVELPEGYQNLTTLITNDLYLKAKYRKKIGKLGLTGNLQLHQLFNFLENKNTEIRQTPFFINPSVGFDWQINKRKMLVASYSFNTSNAGILDTYSNYVLTGFRNFTKGTGEFNQLDASSYILNYDYNNYSGRLSANVFARYSKNHDYFSTNTFIDQNFTQSEKILFKDRELYSVSSKLDYYFKIILSNLKIGLDYSQFNYENSVNDSNFRSINFNKFNFSQQLRSGFSGFFNYHIGITWIYNQIKTNTVDSFTDNIGFLDLSFVFNKKIDFQIQTERYYFGNLDTDNIYYFLDFEARYKMIENKLTLGFTGKNLFNTERYRNFSISDIGNSTTEYRLLPRFVLLKLEYRF